MTEGLQILVYVLVYQDGENISTHVYIYPLCKQMFYSFVSLGFYTCKYLYYRNIQIF